MTHVTPFYEGDLVTSVRLGDEPRQGTLIAIASQDAAWVKWEPGLGEVTGVLELVDLYDVTPSASYIAAPTPVVTVRTVHASTGSHGVVDYLAATGQLEDWPRIAEQALNFVIGKLRASASMDLPYEELPQEHVETVLHTAALRLLRDAVTPEVA